MAMNWTGIHDLILRAKAEDQQAWQALDELARLYLRKLAGPPRTGESARDQMQDALLRAYEKLDSFEGGTDDASTGALFRAWLVMVFKRLQSNTRRKDRTQGRQAPAGTRSLDAESAEAADERSGRLVPVSKELTGSVHARLKERDELVEAAVRSLPDHLDQAVIRMYFFEDVPLGKIAERLGLTYERVRGRLHRSVDRLAPLLTDLL